MRRAAYAGLFGFCALAGAAAAFAFAGASPASVFATITTPTTPTTTTPPEPAPEVLAAGVAIGGINVGGLSPEAAFTTVRTAFETPLVLRLGRFTLKPRPEDLGATAYVQAAVDRARRAPPGTDVALVVRVDGARVRAYVEKVAERFNREPVDSRLFLRRLRPFITRPVPGRSVDRAATVKAIVGALAANTRFPIRIRVRTAPARVTRDSFGPVIVIRRASNRLYLYDGMRLWRTFGVATGQTRYPTPLGRFRIVVKWRNPWWYPPDSDWAEGEKPIPPGPGNPLGTRWMGLSAPGVGIHGTPEPGSIGYSVSHGCIRMQIPHAEWLYTKVSIGTPVFIVAA